MRKELHSSNFHICICGVFNCVLCIIDPEVIKYFVFSTYFHLFTSFSLYCQNIRLFNGIIFSLHFNMCCVSFRVFIALLHFSPISQRELFILYTNDVEFSAFCYFLLSLPQWHLFCGSLSFNFSHVYLMHQLSKSPGWGTAPKPLQSIGRYWKRTRRKESRKPKQLLRQTMAPSPAERCTQLAKVREKASEEGADRPEWDGDSISAAHGVLPAHLCPGRTRASFIISSYTW